MIDHLHDRQFAEESALYLIHEYGVNFLAKQHDAAV